MISPLQMLRNTVLALLLAWQTGAQAAPQINWGEMLAQAQGKETHESLEIDLRQRWEATLVGSVEPSTEIPLDPDQIWAWPAQRFSSVPHSKPVALRADERMVTRMTVFSDGQDGDLSITVMMPRIDAVHVSYRYDNGPWTTLSAGDRLAMDRWPLADRQPSFHVNLKPGQLDVVMQFAHRGIFDAPVLLQNNRAFLESRTSSIWVAGMFVGISWVMALMGVLMALILQKSSFLSVAVMSLMVSLVLMFGSGLGGMVLRTGSEHFNDQIKFTINTSWGMLLPWVSALALSIHVHSRRWWWSSVVLAGSGVLLAIIWGDYRWRDTSPIGISSMLSFVLLYVICMIAWCWYKNYSRNIGIVLGLLFYVSALFVMVAAYLGVINTDTSGVLAALICLLASLSLIRGLFLQHRMGRQVLARANMSPLRDVLTGLLNREGMQAHLYKLRDQLQQQQTCAVFVYISLLDTQAAMDEYGEQGFEMGMVQVAASLSTSLAVTDSVGRISGHAFGITVQMPLEATLAVRVAQKILARLMAMASHGTPMAGTARIALAWMPLNGYRVDTLERRCKHMLEMLEHTKRIGWVGGAQTHTEAAQLRRDANIADGKPSELPVLPVHGDASGDDASSADLYERIHRIEREMLEGVETSFLVEEADRMNNVLNELHSTQANTQANTQPNTQAAPADQRTLQAGDQPKVQMPKQKPWPG